MGNLRLYKLYLGTYLESVSKIPLSVLGPDRPRQKLFVLQMPSGVFSSPSAHLESHSLKNLSLSASASASTASSTARFSSVPGNGSGAALAHQGTTNSGRSDATSSPGSRDRVDTAPRPFPGTSRTSQQGWVEEEDVDEEEEEEEAGRGAGAGAGAGAGEECSGGEQLGVVEEEEEQLGVVEEEEEEEEDEDAMTHFPGISVVSIIRPLLANGGSVC